jgi:hypothetical protein
VVKELQSAPHARLVHNVPYHTLPRCCVQQEHTVLLRMLSVLDAKEVISAALGRVTVRSACQVMIALMQIVRHLSVWPVLSHERVSLSAVSVMLGHTLMIAVRSLARLVRLVMIVLFQVRHQRHVLLEPTAQKALQHVSLVHQDNTVLQRPVGA